MCLLGSIERPPVIHCFLRLDFGTKTWWVEIRMATARKVSLNSVIEFCTILYPVLMEKGLHIDDDSNFHEMVTI